MCKNQLIFANGRKFEKLILIQICFYPTMPKISLIFRCPKGLIATLLKFAKMQKSAVFCKWRENLKSSYQLKHVFTLPSQKSASFSVSERTFSHFMEICKYAKISWFLQMAGNLKSSYQIKHVFTLPCQKSASFSGVRKDL